MSVSRRQIRTVFVIGFALALVVGAVHGSVLTGFIATSGTIPVEMNSGATVYVSGASDMAGTEFEYDNSVFVATDQGNITVTSNGDSNVSLAASEITGDWTNATSVNASQSAITLDPADKAQITVDGAATDVAWTDYQLDDGQRDLVISGPDGTQSDVTLYGLEAGITVTAVDAEKNTAIDVVEVNQYGQATFTIDHSTTAVLLQEGSQTSTPSQTNPSPTGNLQYPPDTLSIDVDDADFPDDNVTVTMYLDGVMVRKTTIDSARTVTGDISGGYTAGQHTWTVNTTDQYGNERIEQYEYSVPDTLYIRNETNTSQRITDPINVTVQFYGEEEIIERTTSDGTIDLTGLPLNQPLVVDIDASENYTARTTYFNSGDIYEQQSVYLLNTTTADTIETRFVLDDPTGSYGESSVLYISHPINQSGSVEWRTVHADQFGVEGVTAALESDQRYRLRIATEDGSNSQDLGPYRSEVSETVEVVPSAPGVTFTNQTQTFGYGAELDNTSLTWSYYDTDNETDSLTIWIHERGNPDNQLTPNETYLNLGNASGQVTLTENESETEWVVNFVTDRDGDERTYSVLVRNKAKLFPEMLDDGWRQMIAAGVLILLAGSLSVLNVGVGAIVFGVSGGLLWWTGWLGGVTTGAAIVVYLFVAVMVYVYTGGRY